MSKVIVLQRVNVINNFYKKWEYCTYVRLGLRRLSLIGINATISFSLSETKNNYLIMYWVTLLGCSRKLWLNLTLKINPGFVLLKFQCCSPLSTQCCLVWSSCVTSTIHRFHFLLKLHTLRKPSLVHSCGHGNHDRLIIGHRLLQQHNLPVN